MLTLMVARRGKRSLADGYVDIFGGQILGLAGANGTGKSTLMKIWFYMAKPLSGKIGLPSGGPPRYSLPGAVENGVAYFALGLSQNVTVQSCHIDGGTQMV